MRPLFLAICGLLLMTVPSAALDCLAGTPSTVSTVSAEQDLGYLNSRSVSFDRMQSQARDGYIPLYGDSITEAMDVTQISDLIIPMGVNGGTMRDWFGRVNRTPISGTPLSRRASACIWFLGINDTQYEYQHSAPQNPPYLIDLAAAWMTGKWVIVKILPVNETMYSSVTNSQIDAVNAHTQTVFGSRTDFAIVDAKSVLAPSGQLLPAYTTDGLHLSAAGYALLYPLIGAALSTLSVSH